MYYTEFLRALRGLRVIGIVLGILLVLGVGMRLVTLRSASPDAWVSDFTKAPGAVIRQTRLADGSRKTTIDNAAKHTHVTVVDFGIRGKQVSIVEPSGSASRRDYTVIFGSTNRNDDGKTTRILIDTTARFDIDFSVFFALAVLFGLGIATLLSCPLGKENDGHLELVWTKPASREVYALIAISVDIAAIAAAELATVAVFLFMFLLFPGPALTWEPATTGVLLAALLGPVAWYALLTALSASLKRGMGAVVGTAWPVALILPGLSLAYFGESVVGRAVHEIFHTLNFFNPIGYLHLRSVGHAVVIQNAPDAISLLAVLAFVYLALAIVQWRRVEA